MASFQAQKRSTGSGGWQAWRCQERSSHCPADAAGILRWLWDAVGRRPVPCCTALGGSTEAPVPPGEAWTPACGGPAGTQHSCRWHRGRPPRERHGRAMLLGTVLTSPSPTTTQRSRGILRHFPAKTCRMPPIRVAETGPLIGWRMPKPHPATRRRAASHVATEGQHGYASCYRAPVAAQQPNAPKTAGKASPPKGPAVLARLPQCSSATYACQRITHSDTVTEPTAAERPRKRTRSPSPALSRSNLERGPARPLTCPAVVTAFYVKAGLLDEAFHLNICCQACGFPPGTWWSAPSGGPSTDRRRRRGRLRCSTRACETEA